MITTKQNYRLNFYAIGYYILTALLLSLLISCKPSLQTCERLYPPQLKDSISYVEKLDTAFFILPGDTTILRVPIPCPDFIASTNTGKKDVKVVIKDHYLTVSAVSKEDSLKIYTLLKNRYKKDTVIKPVDHTVNKIPKIMWYILSVSIFFNILLILYIRSKK